MIPAFTWIENFLHELEAQGIPAVYLRNHENLPQDIGNDVDLLVPGNALNEATRMAKDCAAESGWRQVRSVEFGPLSMFFANEDGSQFVHIDLFTRLEWHCVPFADPEKILARRQWNGLVFIPDPLDEMLLNVITRLYYHGMIREKHRLQAARILQQEDSGRLPRIIGEHLGNRVAHHMAPLLMEQRWDELEALTPKWRRLLLWQALGKRFPKTLTATMRYLRRAIRRILRPPGPFILIAGPDDTQRAGLIEGLLPLFKELTGRNDTLVFRPRPTRHPADLKAAVPSSANPSPPRPTSNRPVPLLQTLRIWCASWHCYLFHLLPALSKNRAVVTNCESYGFAVKPFPNYRPMRAAILSLASKTLPMPHLVLRLNADPALIHGLAASEATIPSPPRRDKEHPIGPASGRILQLSAHASPSIALASARMLILDHYTMKS